MKAKGILHKRNGETIRREGESVILISSTIPSGEVGTEGDVQVHNDVLSQETYINMIGELLVIMDQQGGENIVAQAIAHYANVTGKVYSQGRGLPDLAYIKGRKERQ
jgi:hypothetical protein